MRFTAAFFALALAAAPAGATDAPGSKDKAGGGPTGATGGPSGTAASTAAGPQQSTLELQRTGQLTKWWEVSATLEEHALVRQNDLAGYGANRWVTAFYGYA